MKTSSPDIEAQNAKLKAKLKRAQQKIRKLKAPNVEVERPSDKRRQPYIMPESAKNSEGSQPRGNGTRVIVLVPGVDVGEILKRIA